MNKETWSIMEDTQMRNWANDVLNRSGIKFDSIEILRDRESNQGLLRDRQEY